MFDEGSNKLRILQEILRQQQVELVEAAVVAGENQLSKNNFPPNRKKSIGTAAHLSHLIHILHFNNRLLFSQAAH